jgi:adapter protein MecA 1/2
LKFRRVNDTTINCIITQDDLKEYGLHIDDLFERKKEAEEFFRGIVAEAARQENFNLESEFASMKIAVLPDHSISLTLSEDPGASAAIRKVREMAGKSIRPSRGQNAVSSGKGEGAGRPSAAQYMFRFETLSEAVLGASRLSGTGIATSLYKDPAEGFYFLIAAKTDQAGHDFEHLVLPLNEFGSLVTGNAGAIAHLREHAQCILKEDAAELLAAVR